MHFHSDLSTNSALKNVLVPLNMKKKKIIINFNNNVRLKYKNVNSLIQLP